jgi:hypothetical protein
VKCLDKIPLADPMTIHFSGSDKTFPATSNALVVMHLVIHQASADVVLGFIGRTGRHSPNDDSDSFAGVAGSALSLHGTKLLKVTDNLALTISIP